MVRVYFLETDSSEADECVGVFRYYGVSCVSENISNKNVVHTICDGRPELIVLFESVLHYINESALLAAIESIPGYCPSILLYNCSKGLFEAAGWNSFARTNVSRSFNDNTVESIRFSDEFMLGGSLSGVEIPVSEFLFAEFYCFQLPANSEWKGVVFAGKQGVDCPVFIGKQSDKWSLYASVKWSFRSCNLPVGILLQYKKLILKKIVLLMLVKKVFKDTVWHYPVVHANLTIDDPRLSRTYGFVDYKKLLMEMRKVGFHTTIAFIPWNYRRNNKDTVALFRQNPDCYSICYHGNNHDRREFYRYSYNVNNEFPDKSLSVHERNIMQSMVRMRQMAEGTGLEIDRVMVFPQGIAPSNTLELLKKYGFLATVNVNNIPLDEPWPEELHFYLDVTTLDYGNFPSIRRFSPEVFFDPEKSWVLEFLIFIGNPIITHTHHQFFASGIDRFGSIAQKFNKFNVVWGSLKTISEKLYKIRRVNVASFEVVALCNSIVLRNDFSEDSVFVVRKKHDSSIIGLSINNEKVGFVVNNGWIECRLSLKCTESATIEFLSQTIEVKNEGGGRLNWRVFFIRILCDIRDMRFVSKILSSIKTTNKL